MPGTALRIWTVCPMGRQTVSPAPGTALPVQLFAVSQNPLPEPLLNVTVQAMAPTTVVVTAAVLLPGTVSDSLALTLAMFGSVQKKSALATNVTVALAPLARVPRLHEGVLSPAPGLHVPCVA